ncbi:MAG: glucan biosynthesis protein D [Cereibacter sphaeroides]|uniref:Glucan biosynthesis protein D n=1 Tax=Cereibacter sphaeroides TaxID=1063 RepID=A0A2W5TYV9_CERSP|nr:MAG: glucan biosynthesis protein D [Cereibacter sphaeroides]
MLASSDRADQMTRRGFIGAMPVAALLWSSVALPRQAVAQDTAAPAAPQQFNFDLLSAEMQALAAQPYVAPTRTPSFLDDLKYDDYRLISFRPDKARWQDEGSFFRLHAFPMGWLFKDPVLLFEVNGDQATPMPVTTDDFQYLNDLATRIPAHAEMPGVAGFRLHTPLNRPDVWDELVAFLGASYFRALGRGTAYGLSARGLAVNSGLSSAEEFPRFSRFYIEKPGDFRETITIYAALESESVTGAYRFVITPGAETLMDVTARLYFRADVDQLGVAPLTSMFLFSEKNRGKFDDFRPNVHDSDGLRIERGDGDIIWRPLNNPPRLAGSYFAEESVHRFGLHQRDRSFESYQDPAAHYERRPSVDVEPLGDWGKGAVRLVEIPTDLEVNDNIVAFWVPETPIRAGESREFAYRLRWGALDRDPEDARAYVYETRAGQGGVSGIENTAGTRKFVVDFKGGLLGALQDGADIEAVVGITKGEVVTQTLSPIAGTDIWRLVLDVSGASGETVELSAHIAGYGRKLTELWLYQWVVE